MQNFELDKRLLGGNWKGSFWYSGVKLWFVICWVRLLGDCMYGQCLILSVIWVRGWLLKWRLWLWWWFQVASTSCRGVRSARVLVANRRVFSAKRCSAVRAPAVATVQVVASDSETLSPYSERFRLNNLSPQEGSRKERNRKGRGYGAGQVSNVFGTGMFLVHVR